MNFLDTIARARRLLHTAPIVRTEKWQGVDISKMPEMATHEVRHFFANIDMPTTELEFYRRQINPNLPWADRHFELDRVSGEPVNPGATWQEWPYAHSANKFRDDLGQFNHTYAERYWPKLAGPRTYLGAKRIGIRHFYGDLRDVVNQLEAEPHTRQAVLPVFFPEDTGGKPGRVPCSLSYHFLMRDNRLDISYFLRSCDFVRHFRDDLYLTVRLALWVLAELRKISPYWEKVEPGQFVITISSLHMFRNDWIKEFAANEQR